WADPRSGVVALHLPLELLEVGEGGTVLRTIGNALRRDHGGERRHGGVDALDEGHDDRLRSKVRIAARVARRRERQVEPALRAQDVASTGCTQRSDRNLAKPRSHDTQVAPCSMAMAANAASGTTLPVAPTSRQSCRTNSQCRGPGCT